MILRMWLPRPIIKRLRLRRRLFGGRIVGLDWRTRARVALKWGEDE